MLFFMSSQLDIEINSKIFNALIVVTFHKTRKNYIFGSDFDNVEFYAVSAWYRNFDTEKAVPPKK